MTPQRAIAEYFAPGRAITVARNGESADVLLNLQQRLRPARLVKGPKVDRENNVWGQGLAQSFLQ